MLREKVTLFIVLIVMIADSSRTSNLPEDTIYIRRLIAMWLENPSLIPNRICRSIDLVAFGTSSRRFVADIICGILSHNLKLT
jgi:hypothetical protein